MKNSEREVAVGARIRAARHERGLTIPEVADATGLTSGFLSQLERDLTSVSLSSLARICGALGMRFGDVLDDAPGGSLIRRDDQIARALALGEQRHLLLSSHEERRFHVAESRIPPGEGAGEELYELPADVELVYVLEGALELQVGADTILLEAGDAFTYSPREPHTWRNPSTDEEAVVLWVAVPNPYAPERP